jgi:hypothetical protein
LIIDDRVADDSLTLLAAIVATLGSTPDESTTLMNAVAVCETAPLTPWRVIVDTPRRVLESVTTVIVDVAAKFIDGVTTAGARPVPGAWLPPVRDRDTGLLKPFAD